MISIVPMLNGQFLYVCKWKLRFECGFDDKKNNEMSESNKRLLTHSAYAVLRESKQQKKKNIFWIFFFASVTESSMTQASWLDPKLTKGTWKQWDLVCVCVNVKAAVFGVRRTTYANNRSIDGINERYTRIVKWISKNYLNFLFSADTQDTKHIFMCARHKRHTNMYRSVITMESGKTIRKWKKNNNNNKPIERKFRSESRCHERCGTIYCGVCNMAV